MSDRFAPGDAVRVMTGDPPHHVRTPGYLKGRSGTVTRVVGAFRNPETLAYGGDGLPKQALYLVRFDQTHIWEHYESAARYQNDRLLIDMYEHWLEPAPEE